MDVPRPKDVAAFKAARPKDFPSCLKAIKQYGLLLNQAERLGESDLITAIEQALYHLRYCYYFYTENCDYEGKYFMLLYEDQFPDLTLRPQLSCEFDIATVVSSMYPGSCDPSTLEACSESPLREIVYTPISPRASSTSTTSSMKDCIPASQLSESERSIQSRLASFRDAYSVDCVPATSGNCDVNCDSDQSDDEFDDDSCSIYSESSCDNDDHSIVYAEPPVPLVPEEVKVEPAPVNSPGDAFCYSRDTSDFEQFELIHQRVLCGVSYNEYVRNNGPNDSSIVWVRSDNKCLQSIKGQIVRERFRVISLEGEQTDTQSCDDVLLHRCFLSRRVIPMSNERYLCIDFPLENSRSLSSMCIPALARDLVQLAGG